MNPLDAASRLVTRREAEPLLGYAPGGLKAVMQQQRGRWPEPVACRRRDRALLWDLDAVLAAARPSTAVRSRRPDGADPDGLVTCLVCGRRFRSLAPHLARVHEMSAADYRAEHALPATTALMATDVRRSLSATRTEAMAANPDLIEPMRASTPPPRGRTRTPLRPGPRRHRRPSLHPRRAPERRPTHRPDRPAGPPGQPRSDRPSSRLHIDGRGDRRHPRPAEPCRRHPDRRWRQHREALAPPAPAMRPPTRSERRQGLVWSIT